MKRTLCFPFACLFFGSLASAQSLTWNPQPQNSVLAGSSYTVGATYNRTPGATTVQIKLFRKVGAGTWQQWGSTVGGSTTATITMQESNVAAGSISYYAEGLDNSNGQGGASGGPVHRLYLPNSTTGITVTATSNTNPTIAWTLAPANASVNQQLSVQAQGSDADGNLGSITVWRENGNSATTTGSNVSQLTSNTFTYTPSTLGTVTFHAQATDLVGNPSPVIDLVVNVSSAVAGILAWNPSPPVAALVGTSYPVGATYSVNNGATVIQLRLYRNGVLWVNPPVGNGGPPGNPGLSTATTAIEPTLTSGMIGQTITYRVEGWDNGGEANGTPVMKDFRQIAVPVVPNRAPTVAWTQNPSTGTVGQPLTIQAQANDQDGNLGSLTVWRDGANPNIISGTNLAQVTSNVPSFTPAASAILTFTAQATDSLGVASPTISWPVTVNPSVATNIPPTISWVQAPTFVTVGQSFIVQAQGSDVDGNLANVSVWRGTQLVANNNTFGSSLLSDAAAYSQSSSGIVTYTAQATDGNGSKSALIFLTVVVDTAAPPGGGSGGPGSLPPPIGTLVAALPGDLSVDNKGAANYTVPLSLPPGRAGMEPKVSLNYNSQGGNGPLGIGWSVATGFPRSITRGRSILARDGIVRGVTFDDTNSDLRFRDKLYLDGKRLLCVTGSYGQPGSVYRTEVDSFVTIVAVADPANVGRVGSFVLEDKSGIAMTFGKYPGAPNANGYQSGTLGRNGLLDELAYEWALTHVEDRVGNAVDLSYLTAGDGEYQIGTIDYTSNLSQNVSAQFRIGFAYVADRTDKSMVYVSGRRFPRSQRLDSVVVSRLEGSLWQERDKYILGYRNSPDSERLQLIYLTELLWAETTGSFQPLRPTTFDWTEKSAPIVTSPLNLPTGSTGQPPQLSGYRVFGFGDFDGDGKEDYLDASNGFTIYRSTGSTVSGAQFVVEQWPGSLPFPAGEAGIGWGILLADLNGDGRKDVIFCQNPQSESDSPVVVPCLSTGNKVSGFTVGSPVTLPWFNTPPGNPDNNDLSYLRAKVFGGLFGRFVPGDYLGEGRDQVLVHGYDGYRYLLRLNPANGQFVIPATPMNPGAKGAGPQVNTLKFGWIIASGVTTTRSIDWSMDMTPMPADFNGDGVLDYAWWEKNCYLSPGGTRAHNVTKWAQVSFSDSLGGGSPGAPSPFLGMGSSSTAANPPITLDSISKYTQIMMTGDFNGDGVADVIIRDSNGWSVRYGQGLLVSGLPATELVSAISPTFTGSGGEILHTVSRFMSKATWDASFEGGLNNWQGPDAVALAHVQADSGANTFVLDVDRDGMSDLVWFVQYKKLNSDPNDARDAAASSANKGWWVSYSRGLSFTAPQKLSGGIWDTIASLPQGYVNGSAVSVNLSTPDLNGDGIPDWVVNQSAGGDYFLQSYAYGTGTFGDLISRVTNGMGRQTDIAYKAAKDDSIYTPGAPVAYPIRELRSSTPVVSDVWHESGTGNPADRPQFSYQYSGNRLDLSGRGGLGFHSFITLDRQTNLFKYQFLAQSFPMTGLTHREETYRWWNTGGQDKFRFISSHDNTVVFDRVGSYATLWPFMSKAIEYRWEDSATAHFPFTQATVNSQPENLFTQAKPAGAHIVITAESRFDNQGGTQLTLPGVSGYNPSDFNGTNTVVGTTTANTTFSGLPGAITDGNLKQISTDFGGGFSENVVTDYYPVSYNGLPGLVRTVTTTVTSPAPYGTESAPVKSYTYWNNTPLVATETIDATDNALDLTTTYTRDARGRVTNIQIANTAATGLQAIGSYSVSSVPAGAFDDRWDRPTTTRNAEPYYHTTTTAYHAFLGLPTSVKGPNYVAGSILDEVTTGYDALGRAVTQTDVLRSLTTTSSYALDNSQVVTPPSGVGGLTLTSVYRVTVTATARPSVSTYYDKLGRAIRSIQENFSGSTVIDTIYNKLGQIVATSLPYPSGGTRYWSASTYDPLGRVATVAAPNGTRTTNAYRGRLTQVTVDASNVVSGITPAAPQTNSTLVDSKGRTVSVWNNDNQPALTWLSGSDGAATSGTAPSIAFALDGFGRMRATTLKGQAQPITATYDALGRQLSLADPDKGNWTYVNNALGQVVSQTDGNTSANTTVSTFDHLGRPLSRTTTGNGSTETAGFYYYDTGSLAGKPNTVAKGLKGWIGAPEREQASASGSTPTVNLHYYDDKGRPALNLAQTDGKWFNTQTTYDAYSRPQEVRHYWKPSGAEAPGTQPYAWQDYGYIYTYDSKSYLLSLTDTVGRSWWDTPAYDYMDRVTSVRKGSGHTTTRTYRATDGVLTAINTGGGSIQNLGFNFDGLGNLTSRTDAGVTGPGGPTETYAYDNLNRLEKRNDVIIVTYQPNGNITTKTEVGGATVALTAYDANRPHAVSAYTFNGQSYALSYDGNGNLLNRTGGGDTWTMKWTGFDKPRWMAKNGVGSEFHYNAARSRVMQLEFDQMSGGAPSRYVRKRTYAMGSTLELNYVAAIPSASPTWNLDTVRIYVPGPDGILGAREFRPAAGGSEKALVYHYDHLGSITAITDWGSTSGYSIASGNKTGRYSEDAWGQRRDPLDWSGAPTTATDDGGPDSLTPRGYTGHEMLDDLGLVHMNGRIYDGLLGRFLSADLKIDGPGNLQGYNRYSYVRNNPLRYVDPDGKEAKDVAAGAIEGPAHAVIDTGSYSPGLANFNDGARMMAAVYRLFGNEEKAAYADSLLADGEQMQQALGGSVEKRKTAVSDWVSEKTGSTDVNQPQRAFTRGATNLLTKALVVAGGARLMNRLDRAKVKNGSGDQGKVRTSATGDGDGRTSTANKGKQQSQDRQGSPHAPGDVLDTQVVVKGGTKPPPPPGTVFSASQGATDAEAGMGVPHGQVQTTTAAAIRDANGTIRPAPELTGDVMNFQHVNVTEGSAPTVFTPPVPNPAPKQKRIGSDGYPYNE